VLRRSVAIALTKIGETSGWTLGHAYIANGVRLISTSIWYGSESELGICAFLPKPVRRKELLWAAGALLSPQSIPPKSVKAPADEAASANGEVHILLAEDNRVNQAVASRLLAKLGCSLVVANNGHEAVELVTKQSFDLVLMDVQMPEMDGLGATKRIRDHEKSTHGHIPIIAMTAHAMESDHARCLEAGMDGYLTKPINPQELVAAIENALDQAARQRTRKGPLDSA
jgi:two-component system, sensor histidine kinase and response regulator